jgi:hypothetical protein
MVRSSCKGKADGLWCPICAAKQGGNTSKVGSCHRNRNADLCDCPVCSRQDEEGSEKQRPSERAKRTVTAIDNGGVVQLDFLPIKLDADSRKKFRETKQRAEYDSKGDAAVVYSSKTAKRKARDAPGIAEASPSSKRMKKGQYF